MASPIITTASFCSGVGWLDEGVRAGLDWLGYGHRAALLCEWEAYAAAVLLARMEDSALEPAPVWCGDLADLDALPFRGLVDIAIAGLPCQPYSVAGKQRGLDDQRSFGDGDGPLPHFLRIVGEMRPSLVFLENVPPWVRGGWFRPFGEELCRMGYAIQEPLFVSAESVGASHRRERVFVLAHAPRFERAEWTRRQRVLDGNSQVAEPDSESGNVHGGKLAGLSHVAGRGGVLADAQRQPGSSEQLDDAGGRTGSGTVDQSVLSGAGGPVGDARSTRAVARSARSRSRDSVGESSEPLANTGRKRGAGRRAAGDVAGTPGAAQGNGEQRKRGRATAHNGEPNVAQPESGGQRELRKPSRRDGFTDGCDWPLGEPSGQGLQERLGGADSEAAQGTIERPSAGLFAPGPGNQHEWGRVVADGSFDYRAPAVKPGVRVLVDGVALVVDASRADQLRCAGNGCVALQAAVAFVELVRRLK